MVIRKEMEKIDRARTKEQALDVLEEMNAMLRKMSLSVAVKDKRFDQLQDKLNSLGWFGFCDDSFKMKDDGPWTQLKLVDPESDEAREIP